MKKLTAILALLLSLASAAQAAPAFTECGMAVHQLNAIADSFGSAALADARKSGIKGEPKCADGGAVIRYQSGHILASFRQGKTLTVEFMQPASLDGYYFTVSRWEVSTVK